MNESTLNVDYDVKICYNVDDNVSYRKGFEILKIPFPNFLKIFPPFLLVYYDEVSVTDSLFIILL